MNSFEDGHVDVEYIPAHTDHTLEINYLPLPANTKEEVTTKLSLGINPTHILRLKITYTAVVLKVVSEQIVTALTALLSGKIYNKNRHQQHPNESKGF